MMSLILAAAVEAQPAVESYGVALDIDWLGLIRAFFSVITMIAGLFFILAGTLGVLRLPDFYSRIHAAGITDTLGAELVLLSLIIQAGVSQMSFKLLLVGFFLFIAGPTATHAVAHAAHTAGLKPKLGRYKAPSIGEADK